MSFFQVVDELIQNLKIKRLLRRSMTGDLSGLAAIGMWTVAGSISQSSLTDGVVSTEDLLSVTLNPSVVDVCAQRLVDVGLWHGPGHSCPRCVQPPAGSWVFHDWFDLRYEKGAKLRITRGKRAELKDRKVTDAVWARDRVGGVLPGGDAIARCRYCGAEVHRKVRASWQYDHVDPTRYVGPTNIAIACTDCNKQKMQRQLGESGMVLHAPGWRPGAVEVAPWPVRGDVGMVAEAPTIEPGEGVASHAAASAEALPPVDSRGVASPADVAAATAARVSGAGMVAEAPTIEPGEGVASHAAASAEALPPVDSRGVASPAGTRNGLSPAAAGIRAAAASPGLPPRQLAGCRGGNEAGVYARTRGSGQGGAGQGIEREEAGRWQGEPGGPARGMPPEAPSAQPHGRRHRRSRRTSPAGESPSQIPPAQPGRSQEQSAHGPLEGLAGAAPDPGTPGRFGSPWYQWHGRPPEDDDAICPEHGVSVPCPICLDSEREEDL